MISCSSTRYSRRDRYPEGRDDREGREKREKDNDRDYPFSQLGIPKGQLPPPGECKIWYPNRPAGQHPPPQSCASALRERPLGAWIVTHEGNRFKIRIFRRLNDRIIDEVRYYLNE